MFLNQLYHSILLWGMVGKAVSDLAWEWLLKTEGEKAEPHFESNNKSPTSKLTFQIFEELGPPFSVKQTHQDQSYQLAVCLSQGTNKESSLVLTSLSHSNFIKQDS